MRINNLLEVKHGESGDDLKFHHQWIIINMRFSLMTKDVLPGWLSASSNRDVVIIFYLVRERFFVELGSKFWRLGWSYLYVNHLGDVFNVKKDC